MLPHQCELLSDAWLGEHDPFDSIEHIGRDYPRLEYMARLQRFTEQQKQRVLRGEV